MKLDVLFFERVSESEQLSAGLKPVRAVWMWWAVLSKKERGRERGERGEYNYTIIKMM